MFIKERVNKGFRLCGLSSSEKPCSDDIGAYKGRVKQERYILKNLNNFRNIFGVLKHFLKHFKKHFLILFFFNPQNFAQKTAEFSERR